jgi:hypothetical protein
MWHRSVRATNDERARALPGDDLIRDAIGSLTHAITIHRPPLDVWPWLAQMGAGARAGWYSYDWIDNGGRRSDERLRPELQSIAVGTLFPAVPNETGAFHVLQIDEGRSLVLGWRPAPGVSPLMTWAFVLRSADPHGTRLVVRARGARDYSFYGLPALRGLPLIRVGHFVMQRRQLLGIAQRTESLTPGSHSREAGSHSREGDVA